MSVMLTVHNTVATVLAAQEPKNPFDGVVPNFNVFGVEFKNAWMKILGGLWALAFAIIAAYAIIACIKFASAKKQGYEHGISESGRDLKTVLIAGAACVGLPIIFTGILSLVG